VSKTKIEWCDYTINPVKGLCPMACSYCYARRMYKRFKWDETIRNEPRSSFVQCFNAPAGSRIFVGSTMELFGDWVDPAWLKGIFNWCRMYKEKTFIFLTKQPQNLIRWSPFPDNCWIGVSATNWMQFSDALGYLTTIKAKVKFLSFEPLLGQIEMDMMQKMLLPRTINWIIIGQQTPVNIKTMPKIGWVEEIVSAADTASIPVFLKSNLISCVDQYEVALKDGKYRQEFPV
jgi:protein gp37